MLEVKFVLSFVEVLLFLVKLVLFEVQLVSLVGSCALRYVSAGVDAVETVFFKLVILLRDLNMEGIFVMYHCENKVCTWVRFFCQIPCDDEK